MERIIDKFRDYSVKDFYTTVNYRKNIVVPYGVVHSTENGAIQPMEEKSVCIRLVKIRSLIWVNLKKCIVWKRSWIWRVNNSWCRRIKLCIKSVNAIMNLFRKHLRFLSSISIGDKVWKNAYKNYNRSQWSIIHCKSHRAYALYAK